MTGKKNDSAILNPRPPKVVSIMSGRELTVYLDADNDSLYHDVEYGFMVTQTSGEIIVLGLRDQHTQQIRKLTDDERELARTLGLIVKDEELDPTRKKELQTAKSLVAPIAELRQSLNLSRQEKELVDRIRSSIDELLESLDISPKEQALIEKIEAAIADCENNLPDDKTVNLLVGEANTYNNYCIRQLVESLHAAVAKKKRKDDLICEIEAAIAACASDHPPNEHDYAALLRESERYNTEQITTLLDSLQTAIVENMDLPEKKECCICRMWEKTMIFIPCGHVAVCGVCAQKQEWKTCPICKAQVQEVYRTYY